VTHRGPFQPQTFCDSVNCFILPDKDRGCITCGELCRKQRQFGDLGAKVLLSAVAQKLRHTKDQILTGIGGFIEEDRLRLVRCIVPGEKDLFESRSRPLISTCDVRAASRGEHTRGL